jgi:hypothetical protein
VRDDFDQVVALHIDLPGFSSWHRGPRVDHGKQSFGTTTLWRVALQRRRGKSPLAIESIDDRYCRSPRGDAVARNATSRMTLEVDVFILFNCPRRDGDQRSCMCLD